MFTLAEPIVFDQFTDRPHLGCAMLIAACAKHGIDVRLVRGQTRFLADMFLRDGDELADLVLGLADGEVAALGMTGLRQALQVRGPEWLVDDLRRVYRRVVTHGELRDCFDADLTTRLVEYEKLFNVVYGHCLLRQGRDDLRIVERYVDEMLAGDPAAIGFSLHGSFDISRAVRRCVKQRRGIPIVVGGSHTSYIAVSRLDELFASDPIDYFVVGEAEATLPALLEALADGREPEGIPNIFYRRGGVVVGDKAPPSHDLDSLPAPDFAQFDLDGSLMPERVLPVMTARGCSWRKCTFCAHHATSEGTYRGFSIERFTELLGELAERYDCRHFVVQDEELPPARARKVAQAVIDAGLEHLRLYTYGRMVKGYADVDLAGLLHRAGFRSYQWGLESGSDRILELMCKGTDVATMAGVLRAFKTAGIANQVCAFVGFPGETREEAQATVDFMEANSDAIARMALGTFSIDPMSPVWLEPERFGLSFDATVEGFVVDYTVRNGMTHDEAEAFNQDFLTRYWFDPARWTSGVGCLPPGVHSRMTQFLCAAHGVVDRKDLVARVAGDDVGDLHPVLVADVVAGAHGFELQPRSVWEAAQVSRARPLKRRPTGALERAAFERAGGAHSVDDIDADVGGAFAGERGRETAERACHAFLLTALSEGWALAFAEPWVLSGTVE